MKLFHWGKDGGEESHVWGFWLIEIKSLFSIVLLKFENGTREAYHEHAFNCVSWTLSGRLFETFLGGVRRPRAHYPSWRPFVTRRDDFHRVKSDGTSWVLSFRGPWADSWREWTREDEFKTLTHGRKVSS